MKLNSFIFVSNLFIIFLISSLLFSLSCDTAVNHHLIIQDPVTNCFQYITNFYDLIIVDLVLVFWAAILNSFVFSFIIKIFLLDIVIILHNEGATSVAPKPKLLGERIAGAARGLIKWAGDKLAALFAPVKEGARYVIQVIQRIVVELIPTLFLGGLLTFLKLFVIFISLHIYSLVFCLVFNLLLGVFCLCHAKNMAQFLFALQNLISGYTKVCKVLIGPHTFNLAVRRGWLLLKSSCLGVIPFVLYLFNLW